MTMKCWLPISINSKQQLSNMLLTMTLQQSASLLKALEMQQPSQLKYMRRTPKLWLKSSGLVEKLKTVHCLTATLTPYTVSMMSSNDRCLFVDVQVILAATALMPSVIAVMNLAILHRTAPTRFLHQNTTPPKQISYKALILPQPKGLITF